MQPMIYAFCLKGQKQLGWCIVEVRSDAGTPDRCKGMLFIAKKLAFLSSYQFT